MRKTKIYATLGPSTFTREKIIKLLREGVDGFRFNFSHGTHERTAKIVKLIRQIEKERNTLIPLVGDLQGPVVRLGEIDPLPVKRGEEVRVINAEKGLAEKKEVPIPNRKFYDMIDEGDLILIESGRIILQVREIHEKSISAEVVVEGIIKKEKTLAIKDKDIPLPTLSHKDVEDVKFAVENDFEFIGLSFVRDPKDVDSLRELLKDFGGEGIKIISKIETRKGVENINEIAKKSDAILVARGDLAIYYDLSIIPKIQRKIVTATRSLGKPVMVATQLLDSMSINPIPSRSEVVDVMTAVNEGVDALMLAGETAVGKYPVETVAWLTKIINEAEKDPVLEVEPKEEEIYDKFAHGIVQLSESMNAKIAAYTKRGTTAYRLARYRPKCLVFALTPLTKVARQLKLLWGVRPFTIKELKAEQAFTEVIEYLREQQELGIGDIVILTAGMTAGTTDIIRIEKIGV